MTHSSTFLADLIRGITATAPTAEDDDAIERHNASALHLNRPRQACSGCRSDQAPFMAAEGDCACEPARVASLQ